MNMKVDTERMFSGGVVKVNVHSLGVDGAVSDLSSSIPGKYAQL